jgi:hypothetical protein
LNDVADPSPQPDRIPIANALALDKQIPRGAISQPVNELKHSGLAAAASAKQRHCFTLMNF